jgi:hypothetical protein
MRRWAFGANSNNNLNLSVPDFTALGNAVSTGTGFDFQDANMGLGFTFWPSGVVGNRGIVAGYFDGDMTFQVSTDGTDLVWEDYDNGPTVIGSIVDGPVKVFLRKYSDQVDYWIKNLRTDVVATGDAVLGAATTMWLDRLVVGRDDNGDHAGGLVFDVWLTVGDITGLNGPGIYLADGVVLNAPGHHYWPMREGAGEVCYSSAGLLHLYNSEGGLGGIDWYDPDPRNGKRWL